MNLGKNHEGFTLVETMVVVVIILIMAISVMPSFGGFARRTKVESAAKDWIAYARYARSRAVLDTVTYRISSDLDQQKFWVTYISDSSDTLGQFISPPGEWGNQVSLDSTVTLSSIQINTDPPVESGLVTMDFTPRGSTVNATLIFKNDNGDENWVEVDGLTGRVEMLSQATTDEQS